MQTVPGAVPAAALLSYSCLSTMALAALQGPPTPPYLHQQALPAGAALTPATAQPWGGGGQHLGSGAVRKMYPCAKPTGVGRAGSPWSSTAAQNLHAGGMGGVECGPVLQAGILVHLLVTGKVFHHKVAQLFSIKLSRGASMHTKTLFSLLLHPYFSFLSGSFNNL